MAILASTLSYLSSLGNHYLRAVTNDHRTPVMDSSRHSPFSPTKPESAEGYKSLDVTVESWDEETVCEWLRTINCTQYEQAFKINNITGSSLIECDQVLLREMGIKKIGDRIRMSVAIKQLRTKATSEVDKPMGGSIAALQSTPHVPVFPCHIPDQGHSDIEIRQAEIATIAKARRYTQKPDTSIYRVIVADVSCPSIVLVASQPPTSSSHSAQ
ncbi:MAG: hypothetical protein Q9170_007488 [Blastenia crenularia]